MKEGKYLKIVTYPKVRAESKYYHLDILSKKFLLQKGILLFSLNKELDAQDSFLECMESGEIFDPRIRKECISRLMTI